MSIIKLGNIGASKVPTPAAGDVTFFADAENSDHPSTKNDTGTVHDLTKTRGAAVKLSEVMISANGLQNDGTNWIFFQSGAIAIYRANSQTAVMSLTSLIVDGDEKIISPTTYNIDATNNDDRYVSWRRRSTTSTVWSQEFCGPINSSDFNVALMTPVGYLNHLNEIGKPHGVKFCDGMFNQVILGPNVDFSFIIERTFSPGPGNGSINDYVTNYRYKFTYDASTALCLLEYGTYPSGTFFTNTYTPYYKGIPHVEIL